MPNLKTSKTEKGLFALIAFAIIYYALIQFQITTADGHPYDAGNYFIMATQAAEGEPISDLKPFTYRIALPYLAGSLFPENITLGFRLINLFFAMFTLLILYFYLGHFLKNRSTVLLLLFLYISSPISPFRFVHYIPSYVDPPALFFVLLLIYLSTRINQMTVKWCLVASAIGAVGSLFREIAVCGALVLAFDQCAKLKLKPPFLSLAPVRTVILSIVPVVTTGLTIALIHNQIESLGTYEYSAQMLGVLELLVDQPSIFFLSWLAAFGFLPLVIVLAFNRTVIAFLADNQAVMVFLMGSVLLGISAGFHTDRIVFWAYPAILLLFGLFLENHPIVNATPRLKLLFFAPLAAGQILAMRMWLPIPDDPLGQLANPGLPERIIFAPYGNTILGQTYASTMLGSARIEMLSQFLLFSVYLGFVLFLSVKADSNPATHREQEV